MKKNTGIIILAITAAFLAGCPKTPTILTEEARLQAIEAEAAATAKAEAEAQERQEAEAKSKEAQAKTEMAAREEARLQEKLQFEDIHFDLDMYTIRETDREVLNELAGWLLKNKSVNIEIEGHADDRGDHEYNLSLGERRAISARDYLTVLGVDASRMSTISYGEEIPLCTNPVEDCWWKNRRVHFLIMK